MKELRIKLDPMKDADLISYVLDLSAEHRNEELKSLLRTAIGLGSDAFWTELNAMVKTPMAVEDALSGVTAHRISYAVKTKNNIKTLYSPWKRVACDEI